MNAVAILARNKIGIINIPKPVPGAYECLVKVETCGLCNGTDLKLIENEHSREKVFYPAVLGHEGAGRVIEKGVKVRNFDVGDNVVNPLLPAPAANAGYSLKYGGMVEYALARDLQAMLDDGLDPGQDPATSATRKFPASISMEDAALILSVKEIYKSLQNFGFRQGMDVLVYGDGPIGFGLCLFLKLKNAGSVYCIGHRRQRLAKIHDEAGVDCVFNSNDINVDQLLAGRKFDLVIDAVGKGKIITEGADRLRPGGKVGVYGVLRPQDSVIDLLDLPNHVSVHVQSFPYREHDCHDEIIEMICAGKINLKQFYSHVLPATQIEQAVALTRSRDAYKVVMRMTNSDI